MSEEFINDVSSKPETPDNDNTDLTIENTALKELLAENRKTMDALKEELKTVKTTNAKLLNQLSVEPQKPSIEELLNKNFNKYAKGK